MSEQKHTFTEFRRSKNIDNDDTVKGRRHKVSDMRFTIIGLFLIVLNAMRAIAQESLPAYQDLELSFEERAADLVSRMTLEEKVSQLVHDAKAIERLSIPAYNWMNEALHGVANMDCHARNPKMQKTGFIAFQVHGESQCQVLYKDIKLVPLSN